jgi:hypothetical protein
MAVMLLIIGVSRIGKAITVLVASPARGLAR